MDLQHLVESLSDGDIEGQLQERLKQDLNPFPGLHGRTYADLGSDFKLGTLTLQNSLSRMVWLSSIDSPFAKPRTEDMEINGAEASECAYILAWGPARLDHLINWQLAQSLYPENEGLALGHRGAFRLEAMEWFEGLMASEDDLQDLTNSLVKIIALSIRAAQSSPHGHVDPEAGEKKKG